MYDFAIIGGGIIGLSTAFRLQQRKPGARIVLLEKETVWAAHQTSRNSGVIHSGIYYKPGSLKARLAKDGNRSMMAFCEQHGVRYDTCGKLIVATKPEELPQLHKLHERGRANGLDLTLISAPRAREIEPKVRCLAAIQVLSTGIVNYRDVCQALVKIIEANGADLRLGTQGKKILQGSGSLVIETNRGSFETRFLINCAGLHSDRIARLEGSRTKAKIVPFRGEYY